MSITRNDYLDILEGQEFLSLSYAGCVIVKNGKLYQRGKVVKKYLSKSCLKTLFYELCQHEGI